MDISKKIEKVGKINKDKLDLLSINESFLKYVKKCRKEIGIPKNGYVEEINGIKVDELYSDPNNISKIEESVKSILSTYKLSKNFEDSIRVYLLYNTFTLTPLNFSIIWKGEYINIEIYKKPTKEEWILIKKSVNATIAAISSGNYKSFNKLQYPEGISTPRPKPKLARNLEILEKYKQIGDVIEEDHKLKKKIKYSIADIEAETFPFDYTKQAKKNMGNIKVIKHRNKGNITGST